MALSTVEAEYKALTGASKKSMYLREIIDEIIVQLLSEELIHSDSQGATQFSVTTGFHHQTKHLRIEFHFGNQAIVDKSGNIIADILTKHLLSLVSYHLSLFD